MSEDESDMKQVNTRLPDSMIREIDALWVGNGGFVNRSQGIRWLLKKGIDAVKEQKK